jgi:hypothetical protein
VSDKHRQPARQWCRIDASRSALCQPLVRLCIVLPKTVPRQHAIDLEELNARIGHRVAHGDRRQRPRRLVPALRVGVSPTPSIAYLSGRNFGVVASTSYLPATVRWVPDHLLHLLSFRAWKKKMLRGCHFVDFPILRVRIKLHDLLTEAAERC